MDEELRHKIETAALLIRALAEASPATDLGLIVSSAESILDDLPVPCQIAHKDEAMCRHESCVRAYREEES